MADDWEATITGSGWGTAIDNEGSEFLRTWFPHLGHCGGPKQFGKVCFSGTVDYHCFPASECDTDMSRR